MGNRAAIIINFEKNIALPNSAPLFFKIPNLESLLNLSIPTSLAF